MPRRSMPWEVTSRASPSANRSPAGWTSPQSDRFADHVHARRPDRARRIRCSCTSPRGPRPSPSSCCTRTRAIRSGTSRRCTGSACVRATSISTSRPRVGKARVELLLRAVERRGLRLHLQLRALQREGDARRARALSRHDAVRATDRLAHADPGGSRGVPRASRPARADRRR